MKPADAIALAVSGALHGAAVLAVLAFAWPGPLPPPRIVTVELAEPSAAAPEPPQPPAPARPARPLPRPMTPPSPAPPLRTVTRDAEPPAPPPVEPPAPPVVAPPAVPQAVAAQPPTPAPAASEPPAQPRVLATAATSSVDVVPSNVLAAPAGGPTAATDRQAAERGPNTTARPGPAVAAIPPTVGPYTKAARPQGGYQVRPSYPAEARQAKAEGTTLLRVHVTAEGNIDDVQIDRSAGHTALDRAAAEAIRKWRFEPARNGSTAVAVWVVIPVRFRLEGDF